ncbi:hypothetical protein SERLADRAFT_368908 [Serpula lacrymans var. lacrymans S7.9]|uniref:Uncharacterized protein n=1 Tax=Serpula lacrymans var. lacrymans (strain S7.9) TaxID=578457 RepID=F8NT39_SERL9|nr:uncharacterized protein SERLADRAFT_368908 [Serpula lacrymans var. lacrymans S7.9]EGO25512.1 hypothetical protein SERLADRAFT_368908 [Serpula lacrymans var. lacrymans S7.9]
METFNVTGMHYCPLIEVIKEAFSSPLAKKFHLFPFKQFFQANSTAPVERVFDEVYTSDAWLQAHDNLQKQPPEPGCNLERVILGLTFWLDSTHLGSFGTAKAWPVYLYFANLSKYICACPNSGACNHVAYIPLKGTHRKSHYSPLLTHCRRELFLAVWQSFLDDEFLHAYKHGIVLKCSNGVVHCIYPCVFTYSADYPEKVLIATTRDMGQCPCPRCLVLKSEIPKMGQVRDLQAQITKARRYTADKIKTAREFIYRLGYSVTSSAVEVNSFADRLNNTSNVFTMLVVDIMHEFELGVWKAVFTHLIHILHASVGGSYTVAKLDARYIPSNFSIWSINNSLLF